MQVKVLSCCPGCAHVNFSFQEIERVLPYETYYVEHCDAEAGGCSQRYVVAYELRVFTRALPIGAPTNPTLPLFPAGNDNG